MDQLSERSRNRKALTRLMELFEKGQVDALDEVVTEDVVLDMPQSCERIRGLANLRAVWGNYPIHGGHTEHYQVLGAEPQYVMTPTFNLVRVEGSGDSPTAVVKIVQGDGSEWWLVTLFAMRGKKVSAMVQYWAPVFPAPEWRAQWVESLA